MRTKIVGQGRVSANYGPSSVFTGVAANRDIQPVVKRFSTIADVYGFNAFALLDINTCHGDDLQPRVISDSLNPEMMGMIEESGDLGACSLFDKLAVSNVPFGWQIGFDPVTGQASIAGSLDEQFDQLLEAFEICGGYCIPVWTVSSYRCVVIYFTHRREGDRRYSQLVLETIELFDELIASGQINLLDETISLNRSELNCLLWSAQGKSVAEIGELLGLSEHAVVHYFNALFEKLDTKTLAGAVFKAAKMGLLQR